MSVEMSVETAARTHGEIDDAAVDARLGEHLARLRERAEGHHAGFREMWRSAEELVRGGKRLRSSVFASALRGLREDGDTTGGTVGGTVGGTADAVDIACAVELLHAAFIVHDDVIDGDLVRRGRPNVSGRAVEAANRAGAVPAAAGAFGQAAGILAGDVLLSAALSLVGSGDVGGATRRALVDLFHDTVFASVAGEHADVWFSLGVEDADATRVLQTIELKTARYSFQTPLEAAAILAGCRPERIRQLRDIARGLGVVYQLRDDVLGVFGSSEATGKSVSADLREGTQTLLIALARTSPEWRSVAHRFGAPDLDEDDAEALRTALRASGALDRVELAIDAECAVVRRRIRHAHLPPMLESYLLDLLVRCAERDA